MFVELLLTGLQMTLKWDNVMQWLQTSLLLKTSPVTDSAEHSRAYDVVSGNDTSA